MTDREMLDLAAKAAEILVGHGDGAQARALSGPGLWFHNDSRDHPMCRKPNRPGNVPWNPLDDDGDAFRLAVKLGLLISQQLSYVAVQRPHGGPETRGLAWHEAYGADAPAATRRAIVCAAAEFGRCLP